MSFGFTAITVRASADPAAGIATIDLANVVRVANGVAKVAVPIRASDSDLSGTAIIEADNRHGAGNERPILPYARGRRLLIVSCNDPLPGASNARASLNSTVRYDFGGSSRFTPARPLSQP